MTVQLLEVILVNVTDLIRKFLSIEKLSSTQWWIQVNLQQIPLVVSLTGALGLSFFFFFKKMFADYPGMNNHTLSVILSGKTSTLRKKKSDQFSSQFNHKKCLISKQPSYFNTQQVHPFTT